MKHQVVIIAGGSGTRFWPASSRKNPKQFLSLTGEASMIQETQRRVIPVVGKNQVSVVSPKEYAAKIKSHLGKKTKVYIEPQAKNTMAAVCLAAWSASDDDSVIAVLPADAFIGNNKEFQNCLKQGFAAAQDKDVIVCMGIKPTFPATGYGYIKVGPLLADGLYKIDSFVEKPDQPRAEEFLRGGKHLWNAGIFIFRISVFKKLVHDHAPDFYKAFHKLGKSKKGLPQIFKGLPSLPIDTALMEKIKAGALIVGDFGWNDLGSWPALAEVQNANSEAGLVMAPAGHYSVKSKNNIAMINSKKFLAMVGVENLILVETPDAILLASKDAAQEIKQIVNHLQSNKKHSKLT